MVNRNKRRLGHNKETLAANHLKSHGLKLIDRNYQCRMGEIDLIAMDQGCLVFVEVKFRSNSKYGTPIECIDHYKRARIIRSAQHFLQYNKVNESLPCRFDVIGIQHGEHPGSHEIQWIPDAFQL